jgi:hypothetical protein
MVVMVYDLALFDFASLGVMSRDSQIQGGERGIGVFHGGFLMVGWS